MTYQARACDPLLKELVEGLPAVAIEGAKGVGKTASAEQLAASVIGLDDEGLRLNIAADPRSILGLATPTLIDEWQLVPPVWDVVRREVDRDPGASSRFILTGSSSPAQGTRVHSGAGRILRLTMRPMALPERGVTEPTVSFAQLLAGGKPEISGMSDFSLAQYSHEILASGFPGIRQMPGKLRARELDSYIDTALEHDITSLGVGIRRPRALRSWFAAYAAATSTTTSYSNILDAATAGEDSKLSRDAAASYRELLEQMWLLEPLPAWMPAFNPLKRLGQAPKHQLADPALAARLVGATEQSLLDDSAGRGITREGTFLGALFESLAVLSVRVFSEPLNARVSHMRTTDATHEIDIIVERDDHCVMAIEVKLSSSIGPKDTRHLSWLEEQIGDRLLEKIVLYTGKMAQRLPDDTALIPLALLGE